MSRSYSVQLLGSAEGTTPLLLLHVTDLSCFAVLCQEYSKSGHLVLEIEEEQPQSKTVQVLLVIGKAEHRFVASIESWESNLARLLPDEGNEAISALFEQFGSVQKLDTSPASMDRPSSKNQKKRSSEFVLLEEPAQSRSAAPGVDRISLRQDTRDTPLRGSSAVSPAESGGRPVAVTPAPPSVLGAIKGSGRLEVSPQAPVAEPSASREKERTPRKVGRYSMVPQAGPESIYRESLKVQKKEPDPHQPEKEKEPETVESPGSGEPIIQPAYAINKLEREKILGSKELGQDLDWIEEKSSISFLYNLSLEPSPLLSGEGTGQVALSSIRIKKEISEQCCLLAERQGGGRLWYLVIQNGSVVGAYEAPESRHTVLLTLLQRQGHLEQESVVKALEYCESHLVPEEVAMDRLNLLDPYFLQKAISAKIQLLMENLSKEAFVWFSFHRLNKAVEITVPPPPEKERKEPEARPKKYTRDMIASLSKQVLSFRSKSWEEMEEIQEELLSFYPRVDGDLPAVVSGLKLSPKAAKFVEQNLTGEYSLRKIYRLSDLSKKDTFSLVFALREEGHLELEEKQPNGLDQAKIRSLIEEKNDAISGQNLFEFLGLHWSAEGEDIEDASRVLMSRLEGASIKAVGPEHAMMASAVINHVNAAKKVLIDKKSRRQYRAGIIQPHEKEKGIALISKQIEMALFRKQGAELKRLLSRLEEFAPEAAEDQRRALLQMKDKVG